MAKLIKEQNIPSWEDLHSFRFTMYPDDLTIITNCPLSEIRKVINKFEEQLQTDGDKNIEDVMKDFGYFAVVGKTTTIHIKR